MRKMAQNIFFDIGIIVIISTLLAFIARMLKQPLIPAYVIAGIILGPYLGFITNLDIISNLSEIGIAFLLFIVGLEIDIKKLKDVGLVASLGGIIQIISVFGVAYLASVYMGFVPAESAYLGLIIALSSTMVVVKLLSDKREVDTLHGRIIIGILLMQDIFAILALSILSQSTFSAAALASALLKGIFVIIVSLAAGKFVLPEVFKFAASSTELLFITSIAVAFIFSIFAGYMGFSIAVGAFIAGIILNVPYNIEIIGKIKPLRDFFSVLFFVSLGMQLSLSSLNYILIPLIIFTLLVVIFKPIVVMAICSLFGYSSKTSFMSSISIGQVSEFSLILAAQGLALGIISQSTFSMTILLSVATIVLTTYCISYSGGIYRNISPILSVFGRMNNKSKSLEYIPKEMKNFVLLCGYNRIGYSIVKRLREMKKSIIVIDYNPATIRKLISEKIPCLYGDVNDSEVLERVNMKSASMVISTVPDKGDSLFLLHSAKKSGYKATIFVTASQIDEALELYDAGADYVILPHFLGGEHVSLILEKFGSDLRKIITNRIKHLEELQNRRVLGHEHPIHTK